jgi:putative transposase
MEARGIRRRCDHRFRDLVHETGDVQLAVTNGVPRSTARDWSRLGHSKVVSFDVAAMSEPELRKEVIALRERNAMLLAVLRLLVVPLKACEVSLARRRVPSGLKKRVLVRAVDRSKGILSLRVALRILGLSKIRYHSSKRETECELDDVSSCPRSHPHQLSAEEREAVKDRVTLEEYRHVPTGTFALHRIRSGTSIRPCCGCSTEPERTSTP